MAWVQIAPGIYINQNLTGAAGGAGQAAANNLRHSNALLHNAPRKSSAAERCSSTSKRTR